MLECLKEFEPIMDETGKGTVQKSYKNESAFVDNDNIDSTGFESSHR